MQGHGQGDRVEQDADRGQGAQEDQQRRGHLLSGREQTAIQGPWQVSNSVVTTDNISLSTVNLLFHGNT